MNPFVSLEFAVAVLLLFGALAFANHHYKIVEETTLLALLLMPLVVLGVSSGTIQEFTAPGGVGAKFRDTAHDKVAIPAEAPASFDPAETMEKTAAPPSTDKLSDGRPLFLTLTFGKKLYALPALVQNIEMIMKVDRDLLVVVVDEKRKFLAMAEPTRLLPFLKGSTAAANLIDGINGGVALPRLDVLIFDSLKAGETTNAQALQAMVNHNLRAMVVVDQDGKPFQMAHRDQIVAKLVTQLAASER